MSSFVDILDLKRNAILQCSSLEALRAEAVELVRRWYAVLVQFSCCNEPHPIVRDVCSYVLKNIDSDLCIKTLSEKLFISKTYLSDVFKQKTGLALTEYLMVLKMERAKKLMRDGSLKNYEIADKLNYKDIEYFGKLFKKYSGSSPTEFRRRQA